LLCQEVNVTGYLMSGVVDVFVIGKPCCKPFKHSLLGCRPNLVTPTSVIFKGFTANEITVFLFAFVHFHPCNVEEEALLSSLRTYVANQPRQVLET